MIKYEIHIVTNYDPPYLDNNLIVVEILDAAMRSAKHIELK